MADKRNKELEKQAVELQEMTTNCDGLRKSLRKKEKETEEKEREIASLNQVCLNWEKLVLFDLASSIVTFPRL